VQSDLLAYSMLHTQPHQHQAHNENDRLIDCLQQMHAYAPYEAQGWLYHVKAGHLRQLAAHQTEKIANNRSPRRLCAGDCLQNTAECGALDGRGEGPCIHEGRLPVQALAKQPECFAVGRVDFLYSVYKIFKISLNLNKKKKKRSRLAQLTICV